MNAKTDNFKKKNYFIEFPKNRNFYFLGSYAKIKDFENSNFEDPEYICVITENEHNNVKENLYKRCDFIQDFEFIRVIEKDTNIELNFIASKENINIGGSDTRLLTLIKNRPLIMKEIKRNTKINFNTKKNIIFRPLFSVPLELKFFNKVFILYILDQNFQNNQSTINNKGINTFNNNNNNFGFNNNMNMGSMNNNNFGFNPMINSNNRKRFSNDFNYEMCHNNYNFDSNFINYTPNYDKPGMVQLNNDFSQIEIKRKNDNILDGPDYLAPEQIYDLDNRKEGNNNNNNNKKSESSIFNDLKNMPQQNLVENPYIMSDYYNLDI